MTNWETMCTNFLNTQYIFFIFGKMTKKQGSRAETHVHGPLGIGSLVCIGPLQNSGFAEVHVASEVRGGQWPETAQWFRVGWSQPACICVVSHGLGCKELKSGNDRDSPWGLLVMTTQGAKAAAFARNWLASRGKGTHKTHSDGDCTKRAEGLPSANPARKNIQHTVRSDSPAKRGGILMFQL